METSTISLKFALDSAAKWPWSWAGSSQPRLMNKPEEEPDTTSPSNLDQLVDQRFLPRGRGVFGRGRVAVAPYFLPFCGRPKGQVYSERGQSVTRTPSLPPALQHHCMEPLRWNQTTN